MAEARRDPSADDRTITQTIRNSDGAEYELQYALNLTSDPSGAGTVTQTVLSDADIPVSGNGALPFSPNALADASSSSLETNAKEPTAPSPFPAASLSGFKNTAWTQNYWFGSVPNQNQQQIQEDNGLTAGVISFAQFLIDLQKYSTSQDLTAIAHFLQVVGDFTAAGGTAELDNAKALEADSAFLSALATLITSLNAKVNKGTGFTEISNAAKLILAGAALGGSTPPPDIAKYLGSAAAALADLGLLVTPQNSVGSLQNDLKYLQSAVQTVSAIQPIFTSNPAALAAMKGIVSVVGDAYGIVQGWNEGGVFGGIEAGWDASALVSGIDALDGATAAADSQVAIAAAADGSFWGAGSADALAGLASTALIIGVVVGLAVLFLGGSHHDDIADMPDKYDEPRYGEGVANLIAGPKGSFSADGLTWKPQYNLSDQSGIMFIEKMLHANAYPDGTMKATTPAWLAKIWNQVEPIFGISETGAGTLSIGLNGTGKDCNDQQIVGVPDTSGQVYQYTQIDAAYQVFESAYAISINDGQSAKMAYYDAADPSAPAPPGSDYYA